MYLSCAALNSKHAVFACVKGYSFWSRSNVVYEFASGKWSQLRACHIDRQRNILFSDQLGCMCVPAVRLISADLLVLSYMKCVLPAISSGPLPPENISVSFSRIRYRLRESLESHGAKLDHFRPLMTIYNWNCRFIKIWYSFEYQVYSFEYEVYLCNLNWTVMALSV